MRNIKCLLIISFLLILFIRGNSQSLSLLDNKYLIAIIYLRTNENINSEIKRIFRRPSKKKNKYAEFNISDQITFLNIWYHRAALKSNNLGIEPKLINDPNLYAAKYEFKSYNNELLGSLVKKPESNLYLTFSEPVEDYLLAEMTIYDPKTFPGIKMGKAMQFFFKFNSNGLIESVLYTGVQYN